MTQTPHSDSVSRRMRPDVARKRIEVFAKRFGSAHIFFAQHAAFPLVLTPQLAYRLRAGFQQDIHGKKQDIPWVAVADLLLSSLCDEVSHELYEMNIVIRELLLNDLQANVDLGPQRIQELSTFLLKDIKHQLDSDDVDVRDIATVQRWTALAYVEPGDAARELAEALRRGMEQNNRPELLRLSSLVETFAQPLTSFTPLLTYARSAGYFARGDMNSAWAQMGELVSSEQSIQIQGIHLPLPPQARDVAMQSESIKQESKDSKFETSETNKKRLSLSDLTSWLWSATEALRDAIDTAEYKYFIFPLMLYKRISDVFDDTIQQYISVYGDEQSAYQSMANKRQQDLLHQQLSANRFFIPTGCRWMELQKNPRHNLGFRINEILRTIVDENPSLRGILDVTDYQEHRSGQPVLSDRHLNSLIEVLSRYRLGLQDVEQDTLAQAFEYLLQQFAEAQGKRGGEFYTPKEVGQLMIHLLSPQAQSTIYDPACGSGGFLMAAYQHSKEVDKNPTIKLFGQEVNPATSSLAKMNAFFHDSLDANIVVGDSLIHPLFVLKDSELQTFDYVISNPPWNQRIGDVSIFEHDPWRRFQQFGLPPRSSMDWAWLEHVYASLNKNGRAGIVLPLGTLFRGNRELEIRRGFVEEDIIECVIQLPENLFYGTGIPCAIIMLNRNKPVEHKNQILLINASSFAEKGKRKNELTSHGTTTITQLYRNWETRENLSRVITRGEAQNADYNLLPSRFMRPQSAECLVLVITDLSIIHEAFRACLTDVEKINSPEDAVYTRGLFIAENYSWDVVIVQVDLGNGNEVNEVERVVDYLHPKVVLSLGLAEGVKDVRIGDIVIATKVYGALDTQIPTNSLLLKAQILAQEDRWLRWVKPAVSQPRPYVVAAPIANTHIPDAPTPDLLRKRFNDIVAINSARYNLTQNTYANLTIRGISDEIFALESKAQKRVAQYVSAFVCELLTNLEPEEILRQLPSKKYLGLVAVPYDEFEEFLRNQENKLWIVDKPSLNVGRPTDVEDLMQAITFHGSGDELVYVFRGDMLEEDVVEATNWRAIPQINKEALGDYVVVSDRKVKDFLRFDCTSDEASNCNPIVLMRYEEESDEDEEYSELEEEDEDLGVVEISYEEFERFLRDQKYKYWSVDKPAIEQFMPGRGTVDELMIALSVCGDRINRLYIFSEDCNLEKVAAGIDWDRVPEIHQADLSNYVVTQDGMGRDFLYFDCTLDAASMGSPAILLSCEEEDEDDEDIDDQPLDSTERIREYYGLVAVSYNEFEDFLRAQENELWQITKPSVPGYVPEYPLTIEELMKAIGQHGDGSQFIYVFRGDLKEEKIISATDIHAIPEIKNLYDYLIRSARSRELLRFDCNLNEAIAAEPIILLPYTNEESK